jgi:hypothetical protein
MSEIFIKSKQFLAEYKINVDNEIVKINTNRDFYAEGFADDDEVEYSLWNTPNDYYFVGARIEIEQIRRQEIKELNDKGVYFHYCKSKTYIKTYKERLNEFLEKYEDADPVYFIQQELKLYLIRINDFTPYSGLDLDQQEEFSYTRDMTVRFLVEQAKKNGYKITIEVDEFELTMDYKIEEIESINDNFSTETNNSIKDMKRLNWQGTELQLTELTKALKESNLLNPELSQKAIFERLKDFMQVGNFNEADKLKEIRKRTKDKTPLLNILETSLNNWIIKKD